MTNDEDEEGFADLFNNNEINMNVAVAEKIKDDYDPIHLPLSIIEILESWKSSPTESSLNGIGISPCDSSSLD